MTLSRRSFVSALGVAGAAHALPWVSARGSESHRAARLTSSTRTDIGAAPLVRLDSNENPYGPAAEAIDALRAAIAEANRYPDSPEDELRAAIAAHHNVAVESVILGCGSTELLMMLTEAFTSPTRGLVTIAPSFETTVDTAKRMSTPIVAVSIDQSLRADLDGMLAASGDAGLIYICNPNNPTGTLNSFSDVKQFINQVASRSPEARIVVDEAYFEYVEDPSYGTAIPIALENPRVIVTRTFSKVHGMAGLRAGYAIAAAPTIATLKPYRIPSGVNALAAHAARTSLGLTSHVQKQIFLNREARSYAMDAMQKLGYAVVPSQSNFFLTDIRRDPKDFQTACRARGVAVGRYFPPLKTHARISIGTMQEMQTAMGIIAEVLKGS